MELSCMTLGVIKNILPALDANAQEYLHAQRKYEDLMKAVVDAGYRYVDISSWETDIFNIAFLKQILSKYGLKVGSYIQFDPTLMLSREEGLEMVCDSAIVNGSMLGTKVVMLVPRLTDKALELNREMRAINLIENLSAAAADAKKYSITVSVENRPDLEIPLCTAQELDNLFQAAPGVMLCYDSGNMYLSGETPDLYFERFADKICYVHLKDLQEISVCETRGHIAYDGRRLASALHGTGFVDFSFLAGKLRENGYQGMATVEYMPAREEMKDFPQMMCRMKKFFETIL